MGELSKMWFRGCALQNKYSSNRFYFEILHFLAFGPCLWIFHIRACEISGRGRAERTDRRVTLTSDRANTPFDTRVKLLRLGNMHVSLLSSRKDRTGLTRFAWRSLCRGRGDYSRWNGLSSPPYTRDILMEIRFRNCRPLLTAPFTTSEVLLLVNAR